MRWRRHKHRHRWFYIQTLTGWGIAECVTCGKWDLY